MLWNLRPIRLVQVLANVLRIRVVPGVPLNGSRPMVGGPQDFEAGVFPAPGPSAEAGKQVNCCKHGEFLRAVPGVWCYDGSFP